MDAGLETDPGKGPGRQEPAVSLTVIHCGFTVTPESPGHRSKLIETEWSKTMASVPKLFPAA